MRESLWSRPLACSAMSYHRRRLPHYHPPEAYLFVTWRLADSLPRCTRKGLEREDGRAFLIRDRILDSCGYGPTWLRDPKIAKIVDDALHRGAEEYRLYGLQAYAIMPNHVHVVMQPFKTLPEITRWIKGSTARAANQLLERTGPFWQDESYDHCIRTTDELNRIIRYVENNPASAGLKDWPWSSSKAHP